MHILINPYSQLSRQRFHADWMQLAGGYAARFPQDKVSLLVPAHIDLPPGSIFPAVNLVRIKQPGSPLLKNRRYRSALQRIFEELSPDNFLTAHPLEWVDRTRQFFLPSAVLRDVTEKKTNLETQAHLLSQGFRLSRGGMVFSRREKDEVIKLLPRAEAQIAVFHRLVAPNDLSISSTGKESVKDIISDGFDYFLCSVAMEKTDYITVLKGFSGFKKWQQSNMRMVVMAASDDEQMLRETIASYRFKDDVRIVSYEEEEVSKLIGAAYAVIEPSVDKTSLETVMKAVSAETLLIFPNGSVAGEIAELDGWSFEPDNPTEVTKSLLASFKDEEERSRRIRKSKEGMEGVEKRDFFRKVRGWVLGEEIY